MPRFHCPGDLSVGGSIELPAGAARHVQVLRMQPGHTLTLFNGDGHEYTALIERMGRSDVVVHVRSREPVDREAPRAVHLAVGMPANERMDWLVEKATELGVASLQPLATARAVLKLQPERAQKKQAHWQSVAESACEQCGRNRVPLIHPVADVAGWLARVRSEPHARFILSPRQGSGSLHTLAAASALVLSGPEGGLTPEEEQAAVAAGFQPVKLGERVLRAETAPLAALTLLTLAA